MAVSLGNVRTLSTASSPLSREPVSSKTPPVSHEKITGADPDKDRPRLHFHGRRLGKPLRPGHRKLVENLLPKLRVSDPAALDTAFDPVPDKIWLEIGFGAGEHLLGQARAHPHVGFIGCEPFINGIAKVLSVIDKEGLDNIRLHDDDARPLLDRLPGSSIDQAFILFADPWPKVRHHKRRFIVPENLDRLARVLKDGAELRFASDHTGYVTWALEYLSAHPAFQWLARRPDDWRFPPKDWVPTRYQEKAEARGEFCTFLRFARKPR